MEKYICLYILSKNKMSQSDDRTIINKYIKDTYRTPSNVMRFLCVNRMECQFLDIFRHDHPELHFLTADDISALSHNHYIENGNNLQETLTFVESKIKEYYNFLFNIWICFKFAIILQIPEKTREEQSVENTIIEYLPIRLTMLIYSLFNLFYRTIIGSLSDELKSGTIQQHVTNIVSLYSKLYLFLQKPDKSLPYFIFDKKSVSLVLLLDVMIFKVFDSLHRVSSVIFDNYIHFVNLMFQTFISLLGNTPTPENINKLNAGLGHVAVFLLDVPNRVLHNDEIRPEYVSKQLMREFENIQIFVDRSVGNSSIFSLKEVMEMKASGRDVTRLFPIDRLVFSPMTPVVLPNTIGMVLEVRRRLNEKQKSTLGDGDSGPIVEALKQKYLRFEETGDYFSFLQNLNNLIDKFTLDHSVNKSDKVAAYADFSECRIKVPDFEIYSRSEMREITDKKKADFIKKQKELDELDKLKEDEKKKQQEQANKDLRFTEMKQAKEKAEARKAEIEMQRQLKEQQRQEIEERERIAAAALAAGLTEKEKEQLTIQRNSNFKNNVKDIFQQFSKEITDGNYQSAAGMLNAKLPPKLFLHVPWTEANMKKFSPKVKQAYEELLASAAAAPAPAPAAASSAAASSQVAVNEAVDPSGEAASSSPSGEAASSSAPLSKKEQKRLKEQQEQQQKLEKQLSFDKKQQEKAQRIQEAVAQRRAAATSKIASVVQMVAAQRATQRATQRAAEEAAIQQFQIEMNSLCEGNGVSCFERMFRCSLSDFFRITTVVRKLSDQDIIRIMSTLVPAPDSASSYVFPLPQYMDLENSRQNCRAFFVLALLNGLRQVENVQFAFIGRTFLQLLACHSRLPPATCAELYIPRETSDFDVYAIFNNRENISHMRPFIVHIFNLFWNLPRDYFHIHFQRNDEQWRQFQAQVGHIYESSPRGALDIVKVSFNTERDGIVEVSDIGFKTEKQFTDVFPFVKSSVALAVAPNPLLSLKYNLDQALFFAYSEDAFGFNLQLEFEFPNAESGLDESLRIIKNILHSFLTNQFDFKGTEGRGRDFYFIHSSNLFKFIMRAIQFEGIQDGGLPRYDTILQKLYEKVKLDSSINAGRFMGAAESLISYFFTPDKQQLAKDNIHTVNLYRETGVGLKGANIRTSRPPIHFFHTYVLNILKHYGFDNGYLESEYNPPGKNLYGGIKQQRQRKYTKKKTNNKKKLHSSIKINNKLKKIKIKSGKLKSSSSRKYGKKHNYKITKKY